MAEDFGFGDWPGPPDWEAAKELANDECRKVWEEAARMAEEEGQKMKWSDWSPEQVAERIAARLRAKAEAGE